MWVQPLHTFLTFSPPSSERFSRVGEDKKGSVVVSWPCLLLPHRNKSPSPAHTTGATLLFIQQRQQQKGRAVTEWCWSTDYKTDWRPDMMYEHKVENSLVHVIMLPAKSCSKCNKYLPLNYCLSFICLYLYLSLFTVCSSVSLYSSMA